MPSNILIKTNIFLTCELHIAFGKNVLVSFKNCLKSVATDHQLCNHTHSVEVNQERQLSRRSPNLIFSPQ